MFLSNNLVKFALFLININQSLSVYEFRAGIVMVEKTFLPFKMEMVGPAIDMAMDVSEQQFGIRFINYKSLYSGHCNAAYATGAIADLKQKHNISVLIGPGCSQDLAICSSLATYYNLPQVTGVGDIMLGENFPILTRLSYNLEKQSVFITSVLEKFQWRHTAIIYDTHDFLMNIQGSSLVTDLRKDLNYPRPYDIPFQSNKERNLDTFLVEASQHARVIIFLGSGGDLRHFMLFAHARGMTSGEYVFITIELFRSEAWGDFSWRRGDGMDSVAKEAYQSLIIFSLTQPEGPRWDAFSKEVRMRAKRDYDFEYGNEEVNIFVEAYYNSVLYLARALNKTIDEGGDPYDGAKVAQSLWNATFPGLFGEIFIDDLGDRIADYSLLDMTDTENGIFEVVAVYSGAGNKLLLNENNSIHWPSGFPPLNEPRCGFKGDSPLCIVQVKSNLMTLLVIAAVLVSFVMAAMATGLYIFKKMKFESQLSSDKWKIKLADVIISGHRRQNSSSRLSLAHDQESEKTRTFSRGSSMDGAGQIFTQIGSYNENIVAIRKIHAAKIDINRNVLLEIKKVCDCQHENLVRFVGASVQLNNIAVFTEYCPKGSLQDILANDAIKLDWLFKYSLMTDIAKGLSYIHNNPIQVHGRLSSSNCVVDNRFVLKLTDFGLHTFYDNDAKHAAGSYSLNRANLWCAPELLSSPNAHSQYGDVYSFGIILQEIIIRREPYDMYDMDPQDIIKRVLATETPPLRPRVDPSSCSPELYHLMHDCWSEAPVLRPKAKEIMKELKAITRDSGISGNILDNLLSRMEQYAENLESLVENRTQAFLEEKRRSEELLYRVLPKSVANQLKRGQTVRPEAYEHVTIYFSDVVGFTSLSAQSSPIQVVDFLNDLYTCFDAVVDSYDVYKVETIGDAYMVVSGLPLQNGNQHAVEISCMSLALLKAANSFKIRHLPDEQLQIRIGLHTGPVCAGVVGLTMPRYCLFGDTVNTASRMESNGEASKIHMSSSTKVLLDLCGTFKTTERGVIDIKGKGKMMTYWLDGSHQTTNGDMQLSEV